MKHFLALCITCIVLIFGGCSSKGGHFGVSSEVQSQAYHMIIKNYKMAFSGSGFIDVSDDNIKAQIYSAGTPVMELHVKDNSVCLNGVCYSRAKFNYEFFGVRHYPNMIDDILLARPIYNKKGYTALDNGGFEQYIEKATINIRYLAIDGDVYFSDRYNNVLIRLSKAVEEQSDGYEVYEG